MVFQGCKSNEYFIMGNVLIWSLYILIGWANEEEKLDFVRFDYVIFEKYDAQTSDRR